MPGFEQGAIVRVPFPYTDRATRQHRPALVVSAGGIGEEGRLICVAMITSVENRRWEDDVTIADFAAAALPAPSVIRPCKLATIEASHAEPLGHLGRPELGAVLTTLKRQFGFDRNEL